MASYGRLPHYTDSHVTLYNGDCIEVMKELPDNSVDAIVTDPPYGLGFLDKAWDALPPGLPWAQECIRVLKPGGHLLAFGGSRTWHRLSVAIEDAGFEIRDSIAWIYGSGFPKSLDVAAAIDRYLGAVREVTGKHSIGIGRGGTGLSGGFGNRRGEGADRKDQPVTDQAIAYQGWGSALKPAFEPIVVGRKPLSGSIAANVLRYGTGAMNITGCRVPITETWDSTTKTPTVTATWGVDEPELVATADDGRVTLGRWPANVLTDSTQLAELDRQSGLALAAELRETLPDGRGIGASRYFPAFRYESKAPTLERPRAGDLVHPTVKPLDLMRWLVRLVTQPGGVVLEPFAGSGTTAEACVIEGFRCIAIERETEYLPLIIARLSKPIALDLFGTEP